MAAMVGVLAAGGGLFVLYLLTRKYTLDEHYPDNESRVPDDPWDLHLTEGGFCSDSDDD